MHGTNDIAKAATQEAARERAYSVPVIDLNAGCPELSSTDRFWPYFAQLPKEQSVHYSKDSMGNQAQ
jgi:hypothetical protein